MKHLSHCINIARGMTGSCRAFTGPLWVQIGIANPCNHRCIMCWDHPSFPEKEAAKTLCNTEKEADQGQKFMELGMLEDLMEDLKYVGTRRVELVGRGEPTLHPKFDLILQILKQHGFNVSVVTNGSLLDKHRCESIVKCSVDRIVVSLNAASPDVYSKINTTARAGLFEKITGSIEKIQKTKKRLGRKTPTLMLSFVICKPNFREGIEMIDLAYKLGVDQIVFKYVIAYPNISFIELTDAEKRDFSSRLSVFIKRAKSYGIDLKIEPPIGDITVNADLYNKKTKTIYSKIPCYIGWVFSLITAEGLVFPCCQCNETIGDLRHKRFRDIWYSDQYDEFRQKMKSFPKHNMQSLSCDCDKCSFEKINTTIYNILHFYSPVHLHEAQRDFTLKQLLPAIFLGKTTRGAKAHKRH